MSETLHLKVALAQVREILDRLSPEDREEFVAVMVREEPGFKKVISKVEKQKQRIERTLSTLLRLYGEKLLRLRQKSKKASRDQEIVRLRDSEKLSFKEIPRRLKELNDKWVGKNGKLITESVCRRQYMRAKTDKKIGLVT
jgi:hypothetical protein